MISCLSCQAEFPLLDATPVLIRHGNSIFPLESFVVGRRQALQRRGNLSRLRSVAVALDSRLPLASRHVPLLLIG
jgi:hypothetical protein